MPKRTWRCMKQKTIWRNRCRLSVPNQQRTLNKLSSELRCRKFVNKHWLSIKIGAKMCKKTCVQRVCIPTELPFSMPPLVVGYRACEIRMHCVGTRASIVHCTLVGWERNLPHRQRWSEEVSLSPFSSSSWKMSRFIKDGLGCLLLPFLPCKRCHTWRNFARLLAN